MLKSFFHFAILNFLPSMQNKLAACYVITTQYSRHQSRRLGWFFGILTWAISRIKRNDIWFQIFLFTHQIQSFRKTWSLIWSALQLSLNQSNTFKKQSCCLLVSLVYTQQAQLFKPAINFTLWQWFNVSHFLWLCSHPHQHFPWWLLRQQEPWPLSPLPPWQSPLLLASGEASRWPQAPREGEVSHPLQPPLHDAHLYLPSCFPHPYHEDFSFCLIKWRIRTKTSTTNSHSVTSKRPNKGSMVSRNI